MGPSNKKKKLSLRAHLIWLVVVAVIPVVFFSAILVTNVAQQRTEALEVNLRSTTKALSAAIDEQIVTVISSLKILSEVEDFSSSYIPDLHRRIKKFVTNQKDWISISVSDVHGTQLFNTYYPYGEALPLLSEEQYFQDVLFTEKTVISGYRLSKAAQEQAITVALPVKRNGKIVSVLIGTLRLSSFSKLLTSQNLPSEWLASIIDNEGIIIARSRQSDKFVGQLATQAILEKIQLNREDVFNHENKDGDLVYGAFKRSKTTGWTVALSIPDQTLGSAFWNTIMTVVAGGLILIMLSILLAVIFGRKIAQPILALSKAASALGRGEKVETIKTSVQEVEIVSLALKNASLKRDQSEEESRMLYSKAQEAIEVRDNFLSVASHELKTPLTTLKLQSQFLERKFSDKLTVTKEEVEKPFSRIADQVQRLIVLVDDLLDVARITSGRMEFHKEKFDLAVIVSEVVQHFESQSVNFGTPITLKVEDSIIGDWDKSRVEQVVTNLVSNAIKYGNSKPLTVILKKEKECAILEVHDQGLGISPEDISRIFERFERAVDGRKISGLGLGLWIVKKILEGLDGSIEVKSELEKGSVFIVKLPLCNT